MSSGRISMPPQDVDRCIYSENIFLILEGSARIAHHSAQYNFIIAYLRLRNATTMMLVNSKIAIILERCILAAP